MTSQTVLPFFKRYVELCFIDVCAWLLDYVVSTSVPVIILFYIFAATVTVNKNIKNTPKIVPKIPPKLTLYVLYNDEGFPRIIIGLFFPLLPLTLAILQFVRVMRPTTLSMHFAYITLIMNIPHVYDILHNIVGCKLVILHL